MSAEFEVEGFAQAPGAYPAAAPGPIPVCLSTDGLRVWMGELAFSAKMNPAWPEPLLTPIGWAQLSIHAHNLQKEALAAWKNMKANYSDPV